MTRDLHQLIDTSVKMITTASRRYKLPYPEDEIFAALGKLCVADISQRGMKPDKKTLAEYCRKTARWLTSNEVKPCLILTGNAGTGKTTIARAVNRLFNIIEEYSKCFLSATALNENFILNPGDSDRHFCEGNGCVWLLLDDMGEEPTEVKEFGNAKSPVIRVVAGRYDRMLPMLITTNLNEQMIEDKYGVRTADRLREMAEWIPFNRNTFRK